MRASKPIRLRDFIRVEEFYFSVVGYNNSNAVKCFLRYVPDEKGDRVKDGRRFRKISHDEAIKIAAKYYDGKIFRVPHADISEVFKPEERIAEAMKNNEVRKVVDFFEQIPLNKMGVTGSRLIGLEGDDSDVDFVVYGKWWFLAREMIKKGIANGKLSEPDSDTWDFIYRKRKITMPFDIFLAQERRKYHRAFLGSTYFDLLYVRDYDELQRDVPEEPGKRLGKLVLQAELLDDSLVFDYPAYFPIKHSEIKAILCFTHTYVGQAFKGEVLEACGYVEEMGGERYLIVGTKREVEDEYIVSLDLLEKMGLMEEFREWRRQALQLP